MQPVPIGVVGELLIGGRGVARGYLGRPEPTAEKFIPNPFSDEPGSRLYKTGDLARYLADGNIEFLGRTDHQVKIRGFRIELGEIEAALRRHPEVRETVVLARGEVENPKSKIQNPKSAGKRLVAYIVPQHEAAPTAGELRAYVKQKLPEYMVPSAFVLLDGIPRTPHGKADHRALPIPDQTHAGLEETFVAPRTSIEATVAAIWAQVLGVDRVGVLDNFFDLGGHSLLATQIISRLRDAFAVEIPVRTLFESPTIGELARWLEAVKDNGAATLPPKISPAMGRFSV